MVREPLTLQDLFDTQSAQQKELDVSPAALTDVERREVVRDLILCLQEETGDVQKAAMIPYKGHLLDAPRVEGSANVCDALVDVAKIVIALAELHGISHEAFADAFMLKTRVISARARASKAKLRDSERVVCVDLDDVVADLDSFREEMARALGAGGLAAGDLSASEAIKEEWYSRGGFRELSPISGAVDGLLGLKELGCRIVYVTARPQWQFKRIAGDTIWWLDHIGAPHDLVLYGKDKLELVYTSICPAWPLAFIEDHERNAKQLAAARIPVLLFDRPHNRHVQESDSMTRVLDWQGVLSHVRSTIGATHE